MQKEKSTTASNNNEYTFMSWTDASWNNSVIIKPNKIHIVITHAAIIVLCASDSTKLGWDRGQRPEAPLGISTAWEVTYPDGTCEDVKRESGWKLTPAANN